MASHPGGLREKCGIFGVHGQDDAAALVALGLHALQHRGQEAAGIVSYDEARFHSFRAPGLVGDSFGADEVIRNLPGASAIGHNRYSTSGQKTQMRDIQPIFAEMAGGGVAFAHNGNFTNAESLRRELVGRGCIFQSTMDTEVIVHLVATASGRTFLDRLVEALRKVEGAYSLLAITSEGIIGARDPHGVRPLVLGDLDGAAILASETCALDIIGARWVRDVEPGEIVHAGAGGVESMKGILGEAPPSFCIFEYIYFSRPDSNFGQRNVYEVRKRIGAVLARETPTDADVVVPVPDSGVPAALGYAEASGLPYELGIIRNHFVGRTFILPTDEMRQSTVRLKHSANLAAVDGKRVVLVDDSIVRGTTSTRIVEMVRTAGAREVHLRIASPPTTGPCFYGVDTPERDKLIASRMTIEEMAGRIGVDSLAFVSIGGLYEAVGGERAGRARTPFCAACFTGDYPIPLTDHAPPAPALLLEAGA